jgi:hypothetical protein
MANITVTEVDVSIPEFWAAMALGALKANTVMAQLVRRDFDSIVATAGDTVNVTKRGGLSVNDKLANTTVTLQTPTNTNIAVLLNKHKEVSYLLEDVASAKAIEDAVNFVEDAAIVIGEQVDLDLLGLYTDAGSTVGSSSDDLDVPIILDARKDLNDAKCPMSGRVMVVGSAPEASLLNKEKFTSYDYGQDMSTRAVIEATLGRKYGFTFLMDQQVITTVSPTTVHNIAFHRDAFVLVSRMLPMPPAGSGAVASTVAEDGVGMRALRSWNPDHLGMQFTLDILYGVKSLRADTHAVEVQSSEAIS